MNFDREECPGMYPPAPLTERERWVSEHGERIYRIVDGLIQGLRAISFGAP